MGTPISAPQSPIFFCSQKVYATPSQQDCYRALASLPAADTFFRFFVEQQLHATSPGADWSTWRDDRPADLRQNVVQLPKIWSFGTCNLALVSYVNAETCSAISFTSWSDINRAASQLVHSCVDINHRGGAATVDAAYYGTKALTLFVWANGALFEDILNQYTSANFPVGINPNTPAALQVISSSNSSVDLFSSMLNSSSYVDIS